MALVLADRVRETTTVTGTGTATLLGAVSGYQSFSAVGNANTTYYVIANQSATEWEVGIGTYTSSGTTLSRDTVLSSSNSGSLVNFSAGTKDVFVDYPASKAVYENAAGNVDGYPITGGTIDNTTIGATTPSTGVFTTLTATGQTSLGGAAGSEAFRAVTTASAVNRIQATGATTLNNPILSAIGSDNEISLNIQTRTGGTQYTRAQILNSGAGNFGISASGGVAFTAIPQGSQVNGYTATGALTTKSPVFAVAGSDTNISQVFQSKGTGAIDLAAGSSGVNISNGGTVTAITRTAGGSNYTTIPSLAISAPTTAGGVQATATPQMAGQTVTVQAAGTGYVVGNTLTVVGGTSSTAAQLRVDSIDGSGGVTATSFVNTAGAYSVLPTNPVSVTGGAGSGATFNITQWFFASQGPIITNAGSGYVEQPTVTFSGGGGSGAAAYASVGGGTVIRALGTTGTQSLDFHTAASASNNAPVLRLRETNTGTSSSSGYVMISNANAYTQIVAQGPATTHLNIASNGDGRINFNTRSTSEVTQMRVSDTASAVNYVQVTGAATGGQPTISTQGSDANINLVLNAKGSSSVLLQTAGQNVFQATGSGAVANRLLITGTASGVAPSVSCVGSDTNIPLVLQPKGTGALQAQQTDSTATGGNARGANAVDWQTSRNTATQVASGVYSVIGGGLSNTTGGTVTTVAGGAGNLSNGTYSGVLAGISNTVSGFGAVAVGGYTNSSLGHLNFVGGGFTNSGTSASAVTTQSGTMNGTTAVTLSGSNASIKVGQLVTGTSIATFPSTYVAAISGTSLTLSQAASGSSTSTLSFYTPHGVVVGGGNNQATGSYSFIGGGGDAGTAANRNVASGDWSVVAGGRANNINSGSTGSVIAGGGDYGGGASGNTISSAASTISGGFANTVTAYGSVITGGAGNTANGQYSVVLGSYAATTRSIQGNVVIGSNASFSGKQGSSQLGIIALNAQTTDATATVLCSNTSAASTNNQVILPNNSAYAFRGEIVSGVTGGGNSKSWTIEGLIKRGANAASTTLVGSTVTSMYADVGAATWTIALSADTTNGGLAVTFTGQAATTIRTVAQIRTTEMTY